MIMWEQLSPEEKRKISFRKFLEDTIESTGRRPSGRTPMQCASVAISTEAFTSKNVYGSSAVSIGGTSVVCCVMGTVVAATRDPMTKGLIDFTVQLHPIASSKFQSDMALQNAAESSYLTRVFSRAVAYERLAVCEGQGAWRLDVSCLVIAFDGSLREALVLGCTAALATLSLPCVTANQAEGIRAVMRGAGATFTLGRTSSPIQILVSFPLAVSMAHMRGAFFAEPTQDEEDALQPSGGPDPHDTGGLMTLLFEGSTGRLLSLYQAPGSAIPLGALCSDPARTHPSAVARISKAYDRRFYGAIHMATAGAGSTVSGAQAIVHLRRKRERDREVMVGCCAAAAMEVAVTVAGADSDSSLQSANE